MAGTKSYMVVLPADLALQVRHIAIDEGKSMTAFLSEVLVDALRFLNKGNGK